MVNPKITWMMPLGVAPWPRKPPHDDKQEISRNSMGSLHFGEKG